MESFNHPTGSAGPPQGGRESEWEPIQHGLLADVQSRGKKMDKNGTEAGKTV